MSTHEQEKGRGPSPTHPPIQPTNRINQLPGQRVAKEAVFERARAVYTPGMSRRQLAEAAGLTQYQAWKILKEMQVLDPSEPA